MKKEKKNPKAILPKGFKDNDEVTISVRKKVSKTIEEVCQNFGFRELKRRVPKGQVEGSHLFGN